MSIRMLWDKFEVALLIEACDKAQKDLITRKEAVSDVSVTLRDLAVSRGFTIDEKFRNENGIALQLSSVEALINGKHSSLGESKLFQEMAALYKGNRKEFDVILREAKEMLTDKSDAKKSASSEIERTEAFQEWLVSLGNPTVGSADKIVEILKRCSRLLFKKKIIDYQIILCTDIDTIEALLGKIKARKKYIFDTEKQYSVCNRTIKCYLRFLKETSEFEITEQGETEQEQKSLSENAFGESGKAISSVETVDTNGLLLLDLREKFNLSFTSPYSIDYKDLHLKGLKSWAELYKQFLIKLIEEYPNIIKSGVGFVGKTSVDIGDENNRYNIMTPKPLVNSLCFEAKLNATNICKRIKGAIELCGISYDEVIIRYVKGKSNAIPAQPSATKKASLRSDDNDFINWMVESKGLAFATARSYRSSLNACDNCAHEFGIYTGSIFDCTSVDEFYPMYNSLMSSNEFVARNATYHNSLTAALSKFGDYISCAGNVSTKLNPTSDMLVNTELSDKCNAVLAEFFQNGYKLGNYMHEVRFISAFEEKYGERPCEENEDISLMLKSVGRIIDDRIYAANEKDESDLSREIVSAIKDAFEKGASAIYIECIFEKFGQRLKNELKIYNEDTFSSVFRNIQELRLGFKVGKTKITAYGCSTETISEIKEFLKSSHVPLSYDDIHEALWYIPLGKIKIALSNHIPEAVCVDTSTYFYAPNFNISSSELSQLIGAMNSTIYSKGYIVPKNLRQIFRENCPSSAMDAENYKDYAIREIFKVLLADKFNFSSSVITEIGTSSDFGTIYEDFASERDRLTLDELKNLSDELGTVIYLNCVLSKMIRISPTEYVNKRLISFDVEAVDNSLDILCDGDYMPLKEFRFYFSLPAFSYRWNGFVLESFLRDYSQKFRLIQLTPSSDNFIGAMVRTSSALKTFDDVAADALANNDEWNNAETALRFLVDNGFQQRNANKGISEIIKRAKQIRSANNE